jgi:hypothetical protein
MAERCVEINYSSAEGLTLRFRPRSVTLVPESTKQHIHAANKELLLALRSFVDNVIERMDSESKPAQGPRRVNVRDAGEAAES